MIQLGQLFSTEDICIHKSSSSCRLQVPIVPQSDGAERDEYRVATDSQELSSGGLRSGQTGREPPPGAGQPPRRLRV